jgi:MYXO-CTERM domain-containing protein
MVADHGCCPGLTCFEAVCDNPSGLCLDKGEFCDDKNFLCCDGLVCHHHTCKAPKPQPAPAPKPATVTTLPSTGSGSDDDPGSGLMGAAALGGLAAIIAAKRLRGKTDPNES